MQFDSYCIQCLVERENRLAHKLLPPREADAYLRECMELILSAPEGVSAPYLVHLFRKALERRGLTQDLYAEEKRTSNAYALRVLPEAEAIVAASEDPLLTALKFAQAGNFMDFGVLGQEQVDTLLRKAVADALVSAVKAGKANDTAKIVEAMQNAQKPANNSFEAVQSAYNNLNPHRKENR